MPAFHEIKNDRRAPPTMPWNQRETSPILWAGYFTEIPKSGNRWQQLRSRKHEQDSQLRILGFTRASVRQSKSQNLQSETQIRHARAKCRVMSVRFMLVLPPRMKVHVERQVTVALENQPGQLAAICTILSENSINIEAISVIDSIEQGVVRLITSDPTKCKQALQARGFYVIEGDVLVLDLFDRIGKLAQICSGLAVARINIDYVYGSVEHAGSPLRLVLKTTDAVRTHALLDSLRDP
jgi:hypothetical protein